MENVTFGSLKRVEMLGGYFVEINKKRPPYFSESEAIQIFNVALLMKLFFPKNIPEPKSFVNTSDRGYSVLFQQIPHGQLHAEMMALTQKLLVTDLTKTEESRLHFLTNSVKADPKYRKIQRQLSTSGFDFEFSPHNFILDQAGNYIFVDIDPVFLESLQAEDYVQGGFRINLSKIKKHIGDKLSESNKELAFKYLRRIFESLPQNAKAEWLKIFPNIVNIEI